MLRAGQSSAARAVFYRAGAAHEGRSARFSVFARASSATRHSVPNNFNNASCGSSGSRPGRVGDLSVSNSRLGGRRVAVIAQRIRAVATTAGGRLAGGGAYPLSCTPLNSSLPCAGFAYWRCAAFRSRGMSASASSAGGQATGSGGTGAAAAAAAGGSTSSSGGSVAVDGVTSAASSAAGTAQQAQPMIEASVPSAVELGLYPVEIAMQVIDGIASTTGMPYWASIVLITVMLRSAMLPLAVVTTRNSARMGLMKPEQDALKEALERDNVTPSNRKHLRYRAESKALFQKYDVKLSRGLWFPLVQIPFFMSFWFALRRMSEQFPAYASGGAAWFQDLGAADPYAVLPTLSALSFLLMLEKGSDGMNSGMMSPNIRLAMRGVTLLIVPITINLPAGTFMYWLTSNTFSLVQSVVLKMPTFRKSFGIPVVPKEPPPGADGKELTWMAVLGAPNPFKAHKMMLDQQAANSHSIVGGGDLGPVPKNAPLPPPPPVTRDMEAPKLKTAAASGSMGKGGVVGQSSKPRKGGGNDFKRKKGKQRA